MSTAAPHIYLFVISDWGTGLGCIALAEDGELLAAHIGPTVAAAQQALGLTGGWPPAQYAAHYPGGYALEWVADTDTHAGFQAAYARHLAKYGGPESPQEEPT